MAQHENLTDTELNSVILKERKRARIGIAICALGIIATSYFYYYCSSTIVDFDIENMTFVQNVIFFASIFVCIVGFAVQMVARSNVKKNVGNQLVASALQEVFDSVDYAPKERLSSSHIEAAKMNFPFKYNRIYGSDLVQATYKGVNVIISDITLEDSSPSSDIGSSNDSTTVFQGLWMICDFRKNLSTELRITERSKIAQSLKRGEVKTDNEAFNKQFFVNTENPHEAFYILTPHMMEYIQSMDAKAKGDTYMCFLREGKVHIAINSKRNSFEINNLNTDVQKLRARFISEIKYITDLIDALRLVDTIFAENIKK